ncbi:hypothetical protein BX611_0614 [Lutibacter oceani]|uniref:Uncharacterized protein n=1 Tax=Lutibacter oceani TaxID=1853311 RepID=A0A3D9S385_9FLAO|nr:hypothetical protein BX611_0614 [Lutibacter oceani]
MTKPHEKQTNYTNEGNLKKMKNFRVHSKRSKKLLNY